MLVERTVKDVVPALQTNRSGVRDSVPPCSCICSSSVQIQKVISNLAEQYKAKETDLEAFKRDYNIRPATVAQ